MSNGFIYVVDAHFIDKIKKIKKSWTQVPVTKMRKSSILNKYFCSVTHLENENKNLPDFDERGSETLGNLIVFEQDVVYIIY
jgi:hypothetical protein